MLAAHRLPSSERLESPAAGARALGHPTCLAVAVALEAAGRACVCDLRLLKPFGMAHSERDGRMVMSELTSRAKRLLLAVTGREAIA